MGVEKSVHPGNHYLSEELEHFYRPQKFPHVSLQSITPCPSPFQKTEI